MQVSQATASGSGGLFSTVLQLLWSRRGADDQLHSLGGQEPSEPGAARVSTCSCPTCHGFRTLCIEDSSCCNFLGPWCRTLLGAKATRSKDATNGAPGLTTRSKDATRSFSHFMRWPVFKGRAVT